jgi:hypothetical protein
LEEKGREVATARKKKKRTIDTVSRGSGQALSLQLPRAIRIVPEHTKVLPEGLDCSRQE